MISQQFSHSGKLSIRRFHLPKILMSVAGALLVFAILPLYYPAVSLESVMRAEAAPTVRLMRGANGSCSAVAVAPGYVLTARHCNNMADAKIDGHPIGKVREFSQKDVMVVEVPGLKCPCAKVAVDAPAAGTPVASIGFPFAVIKIISLGYMQGEAFMDDGESFITHTALTGPGGSGGGTFFLVNGYPVLFALTKGGKEGVFVVAVDVTGLTPQMKGL